MKITIITAFLLILAVCLYGCVRSDIRAEDLLYSICAELELPSGETYLSFAEEGSKGYFSTDMMKNTYGKEAEKIFSLLSDYAVYFSSFAYPYEVAVLKCRSRSDVNKVAALLQKRADEVSIALRDTELSSFADNNLVLIKGRLVISVRSEDPDKTRKLLSELL